MSTMASWVAYLAKNTTFFISFMTLNCLLAALPSAAERVIFAELGIHFELPEGFVRSLLPPDSDSSVVGLWQHQESGYPTINLVRAGSAYGANTSAKELAKEVLTGYHHVGFQDATVSEEALIPKDGITIFKCTVMYTLNGRAMSGIVLYLPLNQLVVVTILSEQKDLTSISDLAANFLGKLKVSSATSMKDNQAQTDNSNLWGVLSAGIVLLFGIITVVLTGRRRAK